MVEYNKVREYKNRLNDMYTRIVQATTLVIALGAFAIAYNKNNIDERTDNSILNNRQNIEAILVKEEKLFKANNAIRIPVDKNRNYF